MDNRTFSEIIKKMLNTGDREMAINTINFITEIIENRILEYEIKFKDIPQAGENHLNIINKYIGIYKQCINEMNDKNLYNGIIKKEKRKITQ